MFRPNMTDKGGSAITKNLGFGCNSWQCNSSRFLITIPSFVSISNITEVYEINDTFCHDNLLDVNINKMSLNKIGCQIHAVFEGNPVNTSVYSIGIDKSLDPFDSIWLKLLTILVYIVEVIASIVMLAFVAYEAKGLAGHFRTLINHLLSYLYGAVSFDM